MEGQLWLFPFSMHVNMMMSVFTNLHLIAVQMTPVVRTDSGDLQWIFESSPYLYTTLQIDIHDACFLLVIVFEVFNLQ